MSEAHSPISALASTGPNRYTVYGEIASGGMAVVLLGRLVGPAGFARNVAIKRLHAQFARDPNFVSMFLDEARLSARIAHANVVATLDVLSQPGEVSVVMEYVPGESLAGLLSMASARGETVPVRIASTLLSGVLHGLHAAHETCGEHGEPLNLVHRDVSPQNVLVGSDGVARLLDFGIAKARGRSRVTPTGELKGKLAYMACEQYLGEEVDRRVDVYGASVVLWEALTGRVLFDGPNDGAVARAVLGAPVEAPSKYAKDIPEALDRIVLRGLSRERAERFATAREMALALEREVGVVPQSEVSDWVHGLAGELLARRADQVRQMQRAGAANASARTLTPQPDPEAQEGEKGTRRIAQDVGSGPRTRAISEGVLPAVTSEARPSAPVSANKRALWVAALLAIMTLSVGALWLAEMRVQNPAPARVAAHPPALPRIESARPVAPAPGAVVPSPELPTPVIKQSAAAEENPARSERKHHAHTVESNNAKTPAKKAVVDCSQPVVVDAQGIRRVKRECL